MNKKPVLYGVIGLAVLIIVIVIATIINSKREEAPVHRAGSDDTQKSESSSKNGTKKLKADLDKYRGKTTVSDAKVDEKKANKESIYLNADNKVLVATDSNNAEEIKNSMLKWNSALGENVFLPAKENGRTDLLIQDDETKVPVNIFGGESLDDEVPDKYKERVVPTQDHRMMILDNLQQRYEEEFNYRMEDEIDQKLGEVIGFGADIQTFKNKLSSESGRKELRDTFKDIKKNAPHNKGITSKDKATDEMDNPYNKTYATMTNYKKELSNLPRLKGHNQELLNVIDSKDKVLKGKEAVDQGKKIDEALQKTLKDIQRGDSNSSSGSKYYDNDDKHDGTKTVAGSNSKMDSAEEFAQLNREYQGGE
ncbi:hypothetical protein [Staphylococcus pettenkoferi]|uniref:hypothetical protein n=1 Tax=Staphylococcus pettenkoferi TaxID=170573 RepID=UPI0025521383|nr:hypothetical protein [Staphylococcus pettenkoferi]MDK7284280.1 hypothetical protein [Staphylococcus pettenkoferi]